MVISLMPCLFAFGPFRGVKELCAQAFITRGAAMTEGITAARKRDGG
jgi:hypothetical protein